MKKWFTELSRKGQIAVVVVALHLCCLAVWSIDYLWNRASAKRPKIAVNMVRIEPPPDRAPKPLPQKSATPTPKKVAAKPQLTKISKPKPPAPQPKAEEALIQELAAHFDAITAPPSTRTPKTEVQIPVLATSKATPFHLGPQSEETIAAFLQEALSLPEFGEVRVQVSIARGGKLRSVEVLSAKSEKNAAFLRNRLPELQFPCLNEDTSLTIVFSNAL